MALTDHVESVIVGDGAFPADLGGRLKFGPDFELVPEADYTVDPPRKARFVQAIRRYYPGIDPNRLAPAIDSQ